MKSFLIWLGLASLVLLLYFVEGLPWNGSQGAGGPLVGLALAVLAFGTVQLVLYLKKQKRDQEETLKVLRALSKGKSQLRFESGLSKSSQAYGQAVNRYLEDIEARANRQREADIKWAALIEHLEIGVLVIDSDHKVRLANPAFAAFFGLEASVLGKKDIELIQSFAIIHAIQEVFEGGQALHRQVTLYYPQVRVVEVHAMPMLNHQGRIHQVGLLLTDMTHAFHFERMRSDFAANASHELRTPVTAIKGFAETLLEDPDLDPQTEKEFLSIIYKESVRLEKIVSDILLISKETNLDGDFHYQWISLQEIVDQLLLVMGEALQAKQLSLHQMGIQDCMVWTDPSRLYQVLLNLLSNAVHYTDLGGSITLMANRSSQDWSVSVMDTGIGIPKTEQVRIFERFYRVDKARSRDSGGTGLGLSIVQTIVESMGGKIDLKSQVGKGSTFTIHLPLQEPEKEQ